MAIKPADRQWLILVAVIAFAGTMIVVAQRTIDAGHEIADRPLPTSALRSVIAFPSPLPAASLLAPVGSGPIVVARDPFAASGVATVQQATRPIVKSVQGATKEQEHWAVSSILFEGSEKSAIVNDAWVTVGDSLAGGSRLTAVEPDHIVVTDAKGIRHKVRIKGGEVW